MFYAALRHTYTHVPKKCILYFSRSAGLNSSIDKYNTHILYPHHSPCLSHVFNQHKENKLFDFCEICFILAFCTNSKTVFM